MMILSSLLHIKENGENKCLLAITEIAEWMILEIGVLFPRNGGLLSYSMSCPEFVE